MEHNNTYMGHDNVLIHVIEHDIVATLDMYTNIQKRANGVLFSTFNIEHA